MVSISIGCGEIMLFIQLISIYYHKNVRYPNYANARQSLNFAPIKPEPADFYPREINHNTMFDCNVFLQSLVYSQDLNGIKLDYEKFKKFNNEIFTLGTRDKYRNYHHLIPNIRILKENNIYRIMFCDDDFSFSAIQRRGHNEDYLNCKSPFCYTDIINETAFRLAPEEYGRIIFNNRYTYHDCGIWYYGRHIYNFISCDKSDYREKMFFRKNPDYIYKNLKYLR